MTLAIMQPYFLPYIGYLQLMNAVDRFVFYDDVAFINRGWVNRNRMLVSGREHLFTVPLIDASQNKAIRDINVSSDPKWRGKLLKTVEQSYKKAPLYETVMPMLEKIVNFTGGDQGDLSVADYIVHSFTELTAYLDITTALVPSSTIYENGHLKAQERILDICRQEGATRYINPVGGQALYDRNYFAEAGIQLNFIQSKRVAYNQQIGKVAPAEFVPWLSILDVLMMNDVNTVRGMLNEFDLL
ncbi:MAG: hypothetical protein EAZ91_19340 [Cytophagales bacterium]|nr:MAG: hypothetical protein EAZ91_19340 [Cytophagales bacterium]